MTGPDHISLTPRGVTAAARCVRQTWLRAFGLKVLLCSVQETGAKRTPNFAVLLTLRCLVPGDCDENYCPFEFWHSILQSLWREDRQHGTRYLRTPRVFLDIHLWVTCACKLGSEQAPFQSSLCDFHVDTSSLHTKPLRYTADRRKRLRHQGRDPSCFRQSVSPFFSPNPAFATL